MFRDASDTHWSGIIAQVHISGLDKPKRIKGTSRWIFLSGIYSATQLGWPFLNKESFAVLNTFELIYWIGVTVDGFDICTYHNNLIFLSDPLSVISYLLKTYFGKIFS